MAQVVFNFQGETNHYELILAYKDCKHNHAVPFGFVLLDGCPEFISGGRRHEDDEIGDALICATCNCHRNFHRREVTFVPIRQPREPDNNVIYVTLDPSLRPHEQQH
ncbi:unnamed protein product [Lupinus luteus]|uniref:ZF-HD dimerization-type domain-containing protein n=1 Tax=Lupinus luteus TaxID=3873 RepID=A0AAV1WTR2_LUPLU